MTEMYMSHHHEVSFCSSEAQGRPQGPNTHSAAASDADNEAYLQEFNAAFQQLSHQPTHADAGHPSLAACTQAHNQHQHARPAHQPLPSQASGMRTPATASILISSGSTPGARSSSKADAAHCLTADAGQVEAAAPGWRTGPVDAAGVLVQVSERPLMCSATMADGSGNVVVGSSDHALYVVDPQVGCKERTLYSKTKGHTEWVTCVCCLPGGRVLSGGMDGRLWLWPACSAAGAEIKSAHDAPVSKVAVLQPCMQGLHSAARHAGSATGAGRAGMTPTSSGSSRMRANSSRVHAAGAQAAGPVLAVSCSYDKTVKVWDVSGRAGKLVSVMTGHSGPVLEMAVCPGGDAVLTGDRKGSLMCWDVNTATSGWGVKDAHAGHITALAWQQQQQQQEQEQPMTDSSSALALSGGQDGCLRAWDGRSGRSVARQPLHVDAQGKGAVGSIVTVYDGGRQLVVTAGADQTLKVADPAASYRPLSTVQLTDFPYSLAAVGSGLVVCGCGDGSVHVVDAVQGKTLYALGAGKAAVRALEVGPDSLVCSGDDGCVVSYRFT